MKPRSKPRRLTLSIDGKQTEPPMQCGYQYEWECIDGLNVELTEAQARELWKRLGAVFGREKEGAARAAVLAAVERVRAHLTHGHIPGMSGATPASLRALLDDIERDARGE